MESQDYHQVSFSPWGAHHEAALKRVSHDLFVDLASRAVARRPLQGIAVRVDDRGYRIDGIEAVYQRALEERVSLDVLRRLSDLPRDRAAFLVYADTGVSVKEFDALSAARQLCAEFGFKIRDQKAARKGRARA